MEGHLEPARGAGIASEPASEAAREWREGWGIILAATIGVAIAGAHFHVIGVVLKPLNAVYGWGRAEIALVLTIAGFVAPVGNVIIGSLSDKWGPRRILLPGTLLFGVTYALIGLAGPQLWTWYAFYTLFVIAVQFVSIVLWTAAVVSNFDRHRGLALAISLSGTGLVLAVIPASVIALIGVFGISGTFAALAAVAVGLMLPLAYLFIHDPPRRPDAPSVAQARVGPAYLITALGLWQFRRLSLAVLPVATAGGVFIAHIQSLLTDGGLTPMQAAGAGAFLGPTMIIGRICTGFLFDRLPAQWVAGCAFASPLLGCLLLLGFDGTFVMAVIAVMAAGLAMGAEVDVLAYLASRYFNLKNYGVLFGVLTGLYGVGVGLGSYLAGQVFDTFGSYAPILGTLAALSLLSAGAVASLGPPPQARQ